MYDLMGKAVGVPVWQLIGPQQRAYVPVGSWTVSAAPAHMAEAVQRYQARGYVSMQLAPLAPPSRCLTGAAALGSQTWLKYHLSPFQNVFDQIDAIAAVAQPGFKVHLDFTMEPLEVSSALGSAGQGPRPSARGHDVGVGAQAHTALCDKLAGYDVVGCLEDSFAPADIHAYKELKARAGKPVVLHHAPMVRPNPRSRSSGLLAMYSRLCWC